MRHILRRAMLVGIMTVMSSALPTGQGNDDDRAVMQALDAFLAGWNSRNPQQWASALHFPHILFEGGIPVTLTQSESDFVARGAALWASAQPDWDRSVWEDRRIVQRLPGVVHVVGRWARLNKPGAVIGRAEVLYIVANKNGRWAIAARSGSRAAQGALKPQG